MTVRCQILHSNPVHMCLRNVVFQPVSISSGISHTLYTVIRCPPANDCSVGAPFSVRLLLERRLLVIPVSPLRVLWIGSCLPDSNYYFLKFKRSRTYFEHNILDIIRSWLVLNNVQSIMIMSEEELFSANYESWLIKHNQLNTTLWA